MKILIFEPHRHPRREDIPHTLENLQGIVGGYIPALYPWEDPVAVVCDDEGLLKGYELNRYIAPGVLIAGTFFICGGVAIDPLDRSSRFAHLGELEIPKGDFNRLAMRISLTSPTSWQLSTRGCSTSRRHSFARSAAFLPSAKMAA